MKNSSIKWIATIILLVLAITTVSVAAKTSSISKTAKDDVKVHLPNFVGLGDKSTDLIDSKSKTTDDSSTTANSGSSSSNNNTNNNNNGSGGALANQQDASMIIFMILMILTGAVLIVYFMVSVHIPFIPESIAIVVYGVILGLIFRFSHSDIVQHVATFDPEKFFLFILPTIIFETGFSLPKTDFFKHISGILMLAIFGTFITFIVVGLGIFAVGHTGLSLYLPLKDSLSFGAIISSTDPVCTLAIFQALNVDPTLYMLVLGESILNDATSIMLYRTVTSVGPFTAKMIFYNIALFFLVAIGSVGLGIGMALLLSLLLKWINIGRFPALETIFMIMFSYMSYVLANALDISGVLAVFFCGITFNQYGAYSLSPYTKLTSNQLFRTAAFICETCVFIYIGMTFSFHDFTFNADLFSWSIFFICLSRAMSVFPICFILNKFLKDKISIQIQIAIWFAGLRGAFAFSLGLDYESDYSSFIRTSTILMVIFTIFVFGIGTYPLLKLLGIKTSSSDQSLDNINKPLNKQSKSKDRSQLYQSVDDKYFKPWFRKKVPPLATEAIEIFEKLVQSSKDMEMGDVSDFDGHGNNSNGFSINNSEFEIGVMDDDDDNNSGGSSTPNNNNFESKSLINQYSSSSSSHHHHSKK